MTRERIQTRKTPLAEPAVHAQSPYTRGRWRLEVSWFYRVYCKSLRQMWRQAMEPHPILSWYESRKNQCLRSYWCRLPDKHPEIECLPKSDNWRACFPEVEADIIAHPATPEGIKAARWDMITTGSGFVDISCPESWHLDSSTGIEYGRCIYPVGHSSKHRSKSGTEWLT